MTFSRRSDRSPLNGVGEAPDYRFTLANERTFLAWVRSALAMMAAGVAVIQFVPGLDLVRHALGLLLILLGGLLAGGSYAHWESNERAMRLGEPLPHSPVPRLVAAALTLTAVAALVLTILDLMGG
ncbi:YidH family protein [Nocardioides taihuensis]|uniref:YidH family protein n=1 Tax=Nocardioides taihuensis TaxID=1835606 RepID=A0ABW0BD18_9ACTN